MATLTFRCRFGKRILLFTALACGGMVLAGIFMAVAMMFAQGTAGLRLATILQDLCLFILPPVLTAVLVCNMPARLLCVDRLPSLRLAILAVLVMIAYIPAMNLIIHLNEQMVLPASLSGLEAWMRSMEEGASEAIKTIIGGSGAGSIVIAVLIMGVLTGVSEELFFRGGLQRLFSTWRMGRHTAIWVTAFIFSFFHLEFYGFVPRLLMGAFFGYLLMWSGSVWLPVLIHACNNSIVAVTTAMGIPEHTLLTDTLGTEPAHWPFVALSVALTALLLWLMAGRSGRPSQPSLVGPSTDSSVSGPTL